MKIPQETQILLSKQVRELKQRLGISADIPTGNDVLFVMQRLGIILLEYPIPREESNSFSAIFLRTKIANQEIYFVGVNTDDYYDRQVFAIAHELYHYENQGTPHISRSEEDQKPEEQKADWFAAEFLLPLDLLREQIVREFGRLNLASINKSAILRFIARVQCTWWLPYKSIVRRLFEADAIGLADYNQLCQIDERNPEGQYYRIGLATNKDIFTKLNEVTRTIGTDSINLEHCLRNFEENIISEDEITTGLTLFNKRPSDFGIDFEIDNQDEEMTAFFMGGDFHED